MARAARSPGLGLEWGQPASQVTAGPDPATFRAGPNPSLVAEYANSALDKSWREERPEIAREEPPD